MPNASPARPAVYRKIADELQQRVSNGEWLPGRRLPTESALVSEFGVNRLTIRQALAQLQLAGVVNIKQGSGVFVSNPPPILEISVDTDADVDTGSVHASIKSIANDVTETVLGYVPDPVESAAARLGIDAAHLTRLDTLVGSGGDPFAVSSYWLDGRRFPDLAERWVLSEPLASVLTSEYGVTPHYDWRAFSAAAAGAIEMSHLGARLGAPMIVRDGVSVDDDGVAVYYVRRRILAERASYVLHYRRDS
jgi:DNA-binding GntR family transcriptional regulator